MSLLSSLAGFAASLSLSISILMTTYITTSCFTASFRPEIYAASDRSSFTNKVIASYSLGAAAFFIGNYHALVAFTYPATPSFVCPNLSNLSPQLFTWNVQTLSYVALIFASGYIMLQCFTQLGAHANSNLHLAAPKKLVTNGIYSWIQHPSYTANFAILGANSALLYRRDGVVACLLPKSISTGNEVEVALQIAYGIVAAAAVGILATRVRNEEAVLKNTFGADWEAYQKRKKRFIPGVIWENVYIWICERWYKRGVIIFVSRTDFPKRLSPNLSYTFTASLAMDFKAVSWHVFFFKSGCPPKTLV